VAPRAVGATLRLDPALRAPGVGQGGQE
jgi:hypothetical protein